MLNQIPFFPGHLGTACARWVLPTSPPNPDLILQRLLPTETDTLLGKLRRQEVLSLLLEGGRNSPKLGSGAQNPNSLRGTAPPPQLP